MSLRSLWTTVSVFTLTEYFHMAKPQWFLAPFQSQLSCSAPVNQHVLSEWSSSSHVSSILWLVAAVLQAPQMIRSNYHKMTQVCDFLWVFPRQCPIICVARTILSLTYQRRDFEICSASGFSRPKFQRYHNPPKNTWSGLLQQFPTHGTRIYFSSFSASLIKQDQGNSGRNGIPETL